MYMYMYIYIYIYIYMQQSVLHSLFTMAQEYKQSKVYMETIEGWR